MPALYENLMASPDHLLTGVGQGRQILPVDLRFTPLATPSLGEHGQPQILYQDSRHRSSRADQGGCDGSAPGPGGGRLVQGDLDTAQQMQW